VIRKSEPLKDYTPFSFSASKDIKGDVAFAGYGITAPEYKYDDYQDINVKNKIVLLLRYEPSGYNDKSFFDGTAYTKHSYIANKVKNAAAHGAIGVLIVTGPSGHADEADVLEPFETPRKEPLSDIPVLQVTRELAGWMLSGADTSLVKAQSGMDKSLKPQSFNLPGVRLEVAVNIKYQEAAPLNLQNVIGYLEGSDPVLKNETIIIGAHYDHLGASNNQIYYGADDNASGIAALLALMRAFGSLSIPPRRTLVFIAFDGEEFGTLGSVYYTRNPLWKTNKTVLMINFDMVGRLQDNKLYVFGSETSPGLEKVLANFNGDINLQFKYGGIGSGSDYLNFYNHKIPVYSFHTGGHTDFHRPSDTADKINNEGIARICRLTFRFIYAAANQNTRPWFKEVPTVPTAAHKDN